MNDARMSFIKHLEDFRRCFIISLIAAGAGFLICYTFAERIFFVMARPVLKVIPEGSTLAMLNISEGFFTYLKLAFYAGVLIASPVIIYQIWYFVAPGLLPREKRFVLPLVIFSLVLFLSGVLFGYFIVFPFGYKFLLTYAKGQIVATLSIGWYISFAVKLLLAFGIIFQLPLVLFFLNFAGVLSADTLRRNRKYAFLASFLVGAILTPPDVITQVFMALPLFLLYEMSIWIIVLFGKKRPEDDQENGADDEGGAPVTDGEDQEAGPGSSPAG